MQYLRTILVQNFANVARLRSILRRKCPSSDVVLQEFVVDDVDDGGNKRFNVFGARYEGLDVAYSSTVSVCLVCLDVLALW